MQNSSNPLRFVVIAVLIGAAFFGAYSFASARSRAQATAPAAAGTTAAPTPASGGAGAADPAAADGSGQPACACCGSSAPTADGITGDPVEGAAKVDGDTQAITVDLSKGYYEPNVITLKAGVPAAITFGQSSGCTGQVISSELGFFEDLTSGPVTVTIDDPQPGEYAFSCGMEMVFGKIVVK